MSLISGMFTLPTGWAIQAYKAACFEVPLEKKSLLGSEIIYKNDYRYEEILKKLPGSHIKDAMQGFLDHVKIRKDLVFIETPNLGFCSAAGTNIFSKHDAAILIAPGFYEADKEACCWTMKHEISHIKNNDSFTVQCVPGICQLAASIFGMCFLSFLPAVGLAFSVGMISNSLFKRWREAKADDFAIENSSDEELKGGRRVLLAMQEANIKERNTSWSKFWISADGNNRLDISHPSVTSRIKKVEKTLHDKQVKIDEVSDKERLDHIKSYMANKNRKLKKAIEEAGGSVGILKNMWSF